ncbi:MAG: ATP-binding cassette domain-containing protein, partial [Planctomycetota bacterium]
MTLVPLLRLSGVTKCFGAVPVVSDVSLDLHGGEIHGLIGANGAGKSTLCNVMSGLLPATSGTMHLSDRTYRPRSPRDAESSGIVKVHQELNLIGTLSVAENLFLDRLPNRFGSLRFRQLHRGARETLDRFGLSGVSSHRLVETLGIGQQQMLEIAIALSRR